MPDPSPPTAATAHHAAGAIHGNEYRWRQHNRLYPVVGVYLQGVVPPCHSLSTSSGRCQSTIRFMDNTHATVFPGIIITDGAREVWAAIVDQYQLKVRK